MIKAILLKPLDGEPEGAEREFSQADFTMLEGLKAVARAPEDLPKAPDAPKATRPAPKPKPSAS
ncbi:hypothetical protein SPH9361_03396 [Sphingobium sp. CECT 9361]|nr:hypothetical protein SPH9361_03396 [Sphingobium sp. CECT 9361]